MCLQVFNIGQQAEPDQFWVDWYAPAAGDRFQPLTFIRVSDLDDRGAIYMGDVLNP